MAISLVAHTIANPVSYFNSLTTSAIDTTGANLIVVYLVNDPGGTSISDSKSNSWTALTAHNASFPQHGRLYYVSNPTVGSGHTFTGPAMGARMCVAAFSGLSASNAFHAENGNQNTTGSISSLTAGSITPAAVGDLIVTGFGNARVGTSTIDSGFTVIDRGSYVSGAYYGAGLAYLIAPSASAVNPTWTLSVTTTDGLCASIATFKAEHTFLAARVRGSNQVIGGGYVS